jgi:hypothetical protein
MEAILIILTILFIAWLFSRIFWKGLVIFCSRHGKLRPFLYFVFLFPIAFFHILFIGFGDKKTTFSKKDTALNKKEAEKKLFFEIKAENKKIATAQEELKKETGQTIDDLIRQKRNKDIAQPYVKRASQRGLNDISGWKFICVGCNTELYIRCRNCAHTEFKEKNDERGYLRKNYLECVKCKEQTEVINHECSKTYQYVSTHFDRNRDRFSKSDYKPLFKKYYS